MLTDIAPHARLVVSRQLLIKSSDHFAHSGKHALYGNPPRWHLITPNKPAPKGAPIAHDPAAVPATPHQMPPEQVSQLKLPDTNSNAPSFNKQIDKLVGFASTGNATAILGMQFGTNTYSVKAAKVANFLLQQMGVHEHVVMHGQKAGEHYALQPPAAAPVADGLQEPGQLAPLAQHVKDTLDTKAAEGDAEFIKLVAANNPEHPQIVAYAQQKLAELKGKAPAPPPTPEPAPAPAPVASPLSMPAFEEGKTTTGVADYYQKAAQKIIDHGLAGNAAVLEDMKAAGLKPNAKGKVSNTWAGKTANSKKLLALYDAAFKHATGGAPAAADQFAVPDAPADEMAAAALSPVGQIDGPLKGLSMGAKLESYPKEKLENIAANHTSALIKEHAKATLAAKHGAAAPDTGPLTAQQLGNLQSIPWHKLKLPAENTNAKSHNAALAKIEAMAFAGDTAGLQAFIDAKAGAKQTYAKKQVLTAQTALAGLQVPGATAAVPVQPAPEPAKAAAALDPEQMDAAAAPAPAASNLTRKQIEGLHGWLNAGQPASKHPDSWSNLWKKLSPATKASVKAGLPPAAAAAPTPAAPPPAAPKTVTAPKTILHNTQPGHSKSWSVYVAPNASGGFDMVTEYGKIGAKQQKTIKSFPSADAAHIAATALKQAKFKNGYVTQGVEYGHQVSIGSTAADTGPKEGDTKQGADGLLVLKDGHWVKVGGAAPAPAGPTYAALKPAHAIEIGTNFKTAVGNKAKLKAWAVAGDAAAIETFIGQIGKKYPASKKYAQALLAAMSGGAAAVAPAAAPAPAPAAKPAASTYPSMDSWVQTGPQGGSNPGGRFKDADGVEWYCKFPPDENHAHSEVLAAKLYEAAGLSAQDAKLVTKNGKIGIASRWAEVKKVGAEGLKSAPGALSGFVVDAWLANWDVVGMGYDNLQAGADGRAMRVDAGGSLQYRAQGDAKPFGHKVDEIDSMRDAKKNPQAAAVFGSLTAADMTASAKKVLAVSDDQIRDLVMAHGPGDVTKKAELIDALIARKEDIAKRFPKAVPKAKVKPKPDPTKLKVTADQLPKPHDFKNWKGAGQGLSSKSHVNDANQAAEQALLDTALQGNLIAIKDYHYDALDKETGAVVGKKPISDHPSNHVKTYWSDLVSTLSFIAYPPEALKEFKAIVATSIAKVSDAFKAHKYGTATKHVEANSRLAFWIALGKTKPAESLLPPGASLEFQSSPAGQPKVTPQMSQQAQSAYQTLTAARPVKRFINGIQSSGSYNDNFRDGRMVTTDGWDAAAMALDAYSYATEKPEGFELYKWISFPGDMGKQMLAAPPGTVFQNPGSMCCSTGPTGTAGFGSDRVRIRYAKGAKAVDSFGSGNHPGEKEITTLPGQRFVILKCHKVMCPVKNKERIELDVLMLPPDPTYVAELETLKGKHGGKS